MLSPEESRELLRQVQENSAKIRNCRAHSFGAIPNEGKLFSIKNKLLCSNCGGMMDTGDALIYARGYKAAGGNPDDVISNYTFHFDKE